MIWLNFSFFVVGNKAIERLLGCLFFLLYFRKKLGFYDRRKVGVYIGPLRAETHSYMKRQLFALFVLKMRTCSQMFSLNPRTPIKAFKLLLLWRKKNIDKIQTKPQSNKNPSFQKNRIFMTLTLTSESKF